MSYDVRPYTVITFNYTVRRQPPILQHCCRLSPSPALSATTTNFFSRPLTNKHIRLFPRCLVSQPASTPPDSLRYYSQSSAAAAASNELVDTTVRSSRLLYISRSHPDTTRRMHYWHDSRAGVGPNGRVKQLTVSVGYSVAESVPNEDACAFQLTDRGCLVTCSPRQ